MNFFLSRALLAPAVVTALATAGAAQAGLVSFDPLDQQGATIAAGDSFVALGYSFTQVSDAPTLLFAGDTVGAYASNGSNSLYAANNAVLSVSNASGEAFSLLSFELGGGNLGFLLDPASVEPWALMVNLLGSFVDGSQQSLSFTIDQTSAGLALQSLGWTGLSSVQFSASGDFSLDNLNLQVSEPALPALLALAMGAALFGSRRGASPR
jgi:hypothetical protein